MTTYEHSARYQRRELGESDQLQPTRWRVWHREGRSNHGTRWARCTEL